MKLTFPSPEFDQAVADVCHGRMDDDQAYSLNQLLRRDSNARDEYLFRTALHARLTSDSDLFTDPLADSEKDFCDTEYMGRTGGHLPDSGGGSSWKWKGAWVVALTVITGLLLVLFSDDELREPGVQPVEINEATTVAVAMLDRTVEARWDDLNEIPQLGDPLDPGKLRLESGLVQILFYSGARVVIEGPAEFELVGSDAMLLRAGRLTAEVTPQATGFQVSTPHANLKEFGHAVTSGDAEPEGLSADFSVNLGTAFGLDVAAAATELHVFEGRVEMESIDSGSFRELEKGKAAAVEDAPEPRPIFMDAWKFASLFELHQRSLAAETSRYERWRESGERLNEDTSLLVRLDFENQTVDGWRLRNACRRGALMSGGTIIGCQWTGGRWPGKQALAFQSVNDRVRLSVPGEYDSLTLALWARVQGLDRRINSLFMSDGFAPGTIHWSIRNDGVMGLTLIGQGPGNFVLATTPSVLPLDRIGRWVHLAVVVEGPGGRIVQYVNGVPVADQSHRIAPPYTIGESELGNWNAEGFPGSDPFLIRNFSGAMDEFCLFGRALEGGEIRELYRRGKPQSEPMAGR